MTGTVHEAGGCAPPVHPTVPAAVNANRVAIKLLVEAGYVSEATANDALNIAHGFDKGPLAAPQNDDDEAEAPFLRAPLPVPADILEARAQGRAEALAIILGLEPETGLDDYIDTIPPGPAGEWSYAWNEAKLRELLRADDSAWSLLQAAEGEYWRNLGYADAAEHAYRLQAAATPPSAPAVEERQARKDATLRGVGFLVDGRRVDPARIAVIIDGQRCSNATLVAGAGVDYTDIANRVQEATGRGIYPSTVKAVLDAAAQAGVPAR